MRYGLHQCKKGGEMGIFNWGKCWFWCFLCVKDLAFRNSDCTQKTLVDHKRPIWSFCDICGSHICQVLTLDESSFYSILANWPPLLWENNTDCKCRLLILSGAEHLTLVPGELPYNGLPGEEQNNLTWCSKQKQPCSSSYCFLLLSSSPRARWSSSRPSPTSCRMTMSPSNHTSHTSGLLRRTMTDTR